jgi:Domain of unknown function (DUF4168)
MMERRTRILPRTAIPLTAALLLGAGTVPALAQATHGAAPPVAATAEPAPGTPAGMPSGRTIARAGHALHDVLAINHHYGARLADTHDPAGKQRIVVLAQQQAAAAIQRQGLTIDRYDQVLELARENPTVRQQLLQAAGITPHPG